MQKERKLIFVIRGQFVVDCIIIHYLPPPTLEEAYTSLPVDL